MLVNSRLNLFLLLHQTFGIFRNNLDVFKIRSIEICIIMKIHQSDCRCRSEREISRISFSVRFLCCFHQFLCIILDLEISDHGISCLNDFLRGRTIEFHHRNSLLNGLLLCRRQIHLREINAGHDVMNCKIFDTSILHFNRRQIVDRIHEISGDVCVNLKVSVGQHILFGHACGKTGSDAGRNVAGLFRRQLYARPEIFHRLVAGGLEIQNLIGLHTDRRVTASVRP